MNTRTLILSLVATTSTLVLSAVAASEVQNASWNWKNLGKPTNTASTTTLSQENQSSSSSSSLRALSQSQRQEQEDEQREQEQGGGGGEEELLSADRKLQAFDFFDIDVDLCDNRVDGAFGNGGVPQLERCNVNRFRQCSSNQEICYNRKPSRDHFVPGTHQPVYYIQYDRVFCYPNTWGGCSSCTPGRYCASESRCILEELDYPCERWF